MNRPIIWFLLKKFLLINKHFFPFFWNFELVPKIVIKKNNFSSVHIKKKLQKNAKKSHKIANSVSLNKILKCLHEKRGRHDWLLLKYFSIKDSVFHFDAGVNFHTNSENCVERRSKSRPFDLPALWFHSHERHAYHETVVVLQEIKTMGRQHLTTICTALTGKTNHTDEGRFITIRIACESERHYLASCNTGS